MITQKLSKEIFEKKYMINGEQSMEEVLRGVAYNIAQAEEPEKAGEWAEKFLTEMESGRFIPAGRILANARPNPTMPYYNNCYTVGINDSIESIYATLANDARISATGGGVGINVTNLRYKNCPISRGGKSSGVISFLKVFDASAKVIQTGGNRRAAHIAILDISHPEVEEFITCKQGDDNKELTQFNISVRVSDEFMLAVETDDDWNLTFDGKVVKTVRAKELMRKLVENNYWYAEPGIMFGDTVQRNNNLYYEPSMTMNVANPCAEIVGAPYFVCCLSSINLSKFVVDPFSPKAVFDRSAFRNTVGVGVRFLDNVLTTTQYPIDRIAEQAINYRRIGLGITGLGDCLVKLGIKYGSPEGVEAVENLMESLRDFSYASSVELAKEKGPFPLFKAQYLSGNFVSRLPAHIKQGIREHGIRNAYLNTIAPTGTTSLSLGDNCSSGIEPIFSLSYNRTYRTGKGDETATETVYDKAWLEYIEHREMASDFVPEYFQTANDLSVKEHVDIQAIAQRYVDQSISKTINLPSGTSIDQMMDVYRYAWGQGVKGCTVYNPDGRLKPILSTDTPSDKSEGIVSIEAPERPQELPCEIKEFMYQKVKYLALVGMLEGSPYEIFVVESDGEHYGKRRGNFSIYKTDEGIYQLRYEDKVFMEDIAERFDFNDSAATVCLMASSLLRYGVPVEKVVAQLQKKGHMFAFPKAVSRALKKFIPDIEASLDNPCPECGTPMNRVEGCFMCQSCGYGACS